MTLYLLVKYLHVLGAIVILGTGTGIAFFMLMAHRTNDAEFIARTASVVVIADAIFTLSAVILQPVTGGLLMMLSATPITRTLAAGLAWRSTSLRACSGCPSSSCRSRCAISRARRPSSAALCLSATSCCSAAGSRSAFPGFGAAMLILWLMIAKPF